MRKTVKTRMILSLLFLFSAFCTVDAQTYVRYVTLDDLCTKAVYADTVLTSIVLPRGESKLYNYPKFNAAAYELEQVLRDPSKKLLQVWVCGSASPDGLWAYNVKLSMDRTEAAANYLKEVLGIPPHMIHKESLNEDWDRLADLVAESDIPCRNQVLEIIVNKDWAERKKALQQLQGGAVWEILCRDFFPKLRCVRFGIFCEWDPSKPHMVAPRDTVYVRDTVIIVKEKVVVPKDTVTKKEVYEQYREESLEKNKRNIKWLRPNVMAVKTNLLSDGLAFPSLGLEMQLVKGLSLDISGTYGLYNFFSTNDRKVSYYSVSPELRWWCGRHPLQSGSFIGLHANVAEYTLADWKGLVYQSVPGKPSWSAGFTYGACACLDKKAHWGLEFVIGVGYGRYNQYVGSRGEDGSFVPNENIGVQEKDYFGITKLGLSLVYRFSLAGKKK